MSKRWYGVGEFIAGSEDNEHTSLMHSLGPWDVDANPFKAHCQLCPFDTSTSHDMVLRIKLVHAGHKEFTAPAHTLPQSDCACPDCNIE